MKYNWTRDRAIEWIRRHQIISVVGDYKNIVMDGDGIDLYEAKLSHNIDLNKEQLAELLSFVFNDYVKFNTGGMSMLNIVKQRNKNYVERSNKRTN